MPDKPDIPALQKQVFDLVQRSQESILDAGRSFADNLAAMAPGDNDAIDKLLDDAFEFTERVLRSQREFAKSVVKAATAPIAGQAGDGGDDGDGGGDAGTGSDTSA